MKPGPHPFEFGTSNYSKEALKGDRLFSEAYTKLERDFWLKKSEWTLEEAVAISFGRDPRWVNCSTVEPYSSSSPHAYEYYKRREIVPSARNQGYLPDPILSAHFVRWALWIGLPCAVDEYDLVDPRLPSTASTVTKQSAPGIAADPLQMDPNLISLLRKTQAESEEHKSHAQELEVRVEQLEDQLERAQEPRSVKARELSNLARLVYAMARDAYKYDPSKNKNTATGEIGSALDLQGLTLHEQTIREYLKIADDIVQKIKPRKSRG